jgi:hypothetical protein
MKKFIIDALCVVVLFASLIAVVSDMPDAQLWQVVLIKALGIGAGAMAAQIICHNHPEIDNEEV